VNKKDVEVLEQAHSVRLRYILTQCERQKCSDCPLLSNKKCLLGEHLLKLDKEQHCPVPLLQAKALVYGLEVWDEHVLLKKLQDNFTVMKKWSRTANDCKRIHDCLLAIKHEFFPAIQKSVNINVDLKSQIMKWYQDVEDANTTDLTKDNGLDNEKHPDSDKKR